ncbi:hypothetical protein SEA_FORTHEBOIS_9 [Streptomyces phage Forthebois]|uniref:Uncharacterized protein n=1 Tax=Streptomyces phage Forthebois TaxID=2562185 RepID=A0A4D6E2V9_9VIRU|nr:hypothetical protein KMD60_gp35 [Streptomyces phage Forthebois]QBZ72841.1 hypothetical protein SEA_FORTHEBOIS_9 [Streptomyces phage Forthebois]
MSASFVPRVAFENSDDEATVYLALVHYIRLQTGNVLMGRMGAVSELANAASLVKEIQESAKCREEFGPIPTDEDLTKFLENGE